MSLYIYESHCGGLYTSDQPMSNEELYCEECGDSDYCVAMVSSSYELGPLLRDMLGVFDCDGYPLEYLQKFYDRCVEELDD